MTGFSLLFGLVLFSSVNSGNVVKQISPKDVSFPHSSRVQGRIVSGSQAELKQFPYQVSLRAISGPNASICGGSIISQTFVLTAAHCTKGYAKFEIGVGSNMLNSPRYKLTSFVKTEHPQFDPVTLANDIALIKLPSMIPFSSYISAINLPKKSQASSTLLNKQAVVSGFGRMADDAANVSQNLNYVIMRIIGNSECSNIYGSKIVNNNIVCGRGFEDKHQNACLGDSGGPLAIEDDGVSVQIGIVSFVSSRGCSYGDPSGYTKVGKYLAWISKVAGIPLKN